MSKMHINEVYKLFLIYVIKKWM